ncbi:hypothetical protein B0T20DRAFT_127257 [Sordaria brevicollis]|uniref:Uncharacterized protein n=1 Tax=Sordaria brevicollis TaxID=83679 RepID=A0AAE0PL25_SORBR|nr:hypothetical protein B0T20DRAFT_127257 [Sordaria brevicollis]
MRSSKPIQHCDWSISVKRNPGIEVLDPSGEHSAGPDMGCHECRAGTNTTTTRRSVVTLGPFQKQEEKTLCRRYSCTKSNTVPYLCTTFESYHYLEKWTEAKSTYTGASGRVTAMACSRSRGQYGSVSLRIQHQDPYSINEVEKHPVKTLVSDVRSLIPGSSFSSLDSSPRHCSSLKFCHSELSAHYWIYKSIGLEQLGWTMDSSG